MRNNSGWFMLFAPKENPVKSKNMALLYANQMSAVEVEQGVTSHDCVYQSTKRDYGKAVCAATAAITQSCG